MNNDLEQFSEERLMKLSETKGFPPLGDVRALARIALAAKQAKPAAYLYHYLTSEGQQQHLSVAEMNISQESIIKNKVEMKPLYTTPQPAHTEQGGWIKCSEHLPDDDSFVLVTNGKHTGMGAYLRDDHLEDDERWQDEHFEFINKQSNFPVTHWMPLPATPKPESE